MRLDHARPKPAVTPSLEPFVLEDSSVVATLLVSPRGVIVAANARMRAIVTGGSPAPVSGKPLAAYLVEPQDWSVWLNVLESGKRVTLTMRVRGSDGGPVILRGDIGVVVQPGALETVLCGVFVESSNDDQLKLVAQQSARMEALGSLTAGIAHDFNNLLTVLVGNLYLVAEDVRDQPKVFEKLKAARDAGKRGSDLIRQLLAFARREPMQADAIDPGRVIEDVVPLLRRALGGRIKLETQIDAAAGPIKASTAQLESVVVNLAINARDAIEKRGTVKISVALANLSSSDAVEHGLGKAGEYVAVAVSDDGCGIPENALGRVFEPFFSTKTDRGGTGLGLSMVRWFAETCGGAVYVDSTVGAGTTIKLLLPRANDEVAEPSEKTMPLSTLPSGDETVLLLALEDGLRATVQQILEVLGYSVRFARDTHELLSILRAEEVHLLIVDASQRSDGVLPDTLAQVRKMTPHLAVVMATDVAVPTERRPFPATVLVKPFSLAELAGAVRSALDARPAPV
jgi:signal transduction histidine kinase